VIFKQLLREHGFLLPSGSHQPCRAGTYYDDVR
jgi:hypothetical protein